MAFGIFFASSLPNGNNNNGNNNLNLYSAFPGIHGCFTKNRKRKSRRQTDKKLAANGFGQQYFFSVDLQLSRVGALLPKVHEVVWCVRRPWVL